MSDLAGATFGRLTVIEAREPRISGAARRVEPMWLCRCACGTEKVVYQRNLLRGLSTSCGCRTRERAALARRAMRSEQPTSYDLAHLRVRESKGPARSHECGCGRRAEHWAYDHGDPDELVDPYKRPSGSYGYLLYSAKVEHYVALCRPCHGAFDTMARGVRRAGLSA